MFTFTLISMNIDPKMVNFFSNGETIKCQCDMERKIVQTRELYVIILETFSKLLSLPSSSRLGLVAPFGVVKSSHYPRMPMLRSVPPSSVQRAFRRQGIDTLIENG